MNESEFEEWGTVTVHKYIKPKTYIKPVILTIASEANVSNCARPPTLLRCLLLRLISSHLV
jgi:hypothetical protein